MATTTGLSLLDRIKKLNEVGVALSVERNLDHLLDNILQSAQLLTNADGGSIFTVTLDKRLSFDIMRTDSLGIHRGGTAKEKVPFTDLPLFLEDGTPNEKMIVTSTFHRKEVFNIKDAYIEKGFDFSGTRAFDKKTGYRTKAVLTIPIKNYDDDVIAVLQLINPISVDGIVVPFSKEDVRLVESLASQASIAISNQRLLENFKNLFESFITIIAQAIDKKSPTTGNHGKRVPVVSDLLAHAVNKTTSGVYAATTFSEDEFYELKVAALLHDCGKITTPVHLEEKKTKLQAIFDRITLIETRFEVLKAKAEGEPSKIKEYEEEFALIKRLNENRERVTDEIREKVHAIAKHKWRGEEPFLTEDELENILIPKGNLTVAEREIIEYHVVMTIEMLSELLYPKKLLHVPEIAGAHHERIDGKGYPRKLTGEQMSPQAKILAIADVFEALSAPDRPYKRMMTLSTVLKIMQEMVDEGHLDGELFKVFVDQKVYLRYGKEYLTKEQIDIE